MLQAPISDRKTKTEASSKTAEYLPEHEPSSQSIGGIGQSRQSKPLQQRENLAALQKAYGNQAVLRMKGRSTAANPMQGVLQRKCACGNSAASSGSCAECQSKQEGMLQTKLQIGEAGDRYEQEADRVADRVMRMPEPTTKHQVDSKKEGIVQRKVIAFPTTSPSHEQNLPQVVNKVLNSPGQSMDLDTCNFMESRFGQDFSRVRVHADDEAARAASAVQAQAYTMGRDIVFGANEYAPATVEGKRLLAHELTHVVQQGSEKPRHDIKHLPSVQRFVRLGTLQRTPAAPVLSNGNGVSFDRSKVDVSVIPDVVTNPNSTGQPLITPQSVTVKFNDPTITHLSWEFYDPQDQILPGSFSTISGTPNAVSIPFEIRNTDPLAPQIPVWTVVQGRYLLRCVGYNTANEPVAYTDRSFFVWTSKHTGKPPDIAALDAEKAKLEATTKAGSGKSLGEVGSAFTKLKDVTHDLSVLTTGTGTYVGNQCAVKPAGATPTDCTNIVLEVLENTFTQQGRAADWAKVKQKYAKNTQARGGGGMSGLDVQAALQSEAGWKGIYWAPDPKYLVPKVELDKANSNEASYTSGIAKSKKTYYKDFGKKGYPGVSIDQSVTNYAPETPNVGYGNASTTTKDTTQLDKLKKLPFGVLAAHGGEHMTIITYGKVIEVHWSKEATDPDLIEQTDLEKWAVGPRSGYHYYASGAIVAPAVDVDAAFK